MYRIYLSVLINFNAQWRFHHLVRQSWPSGGVGNPESN